MTRGLACPNHPKDQDWRRECSELAEKRLPPTEGGRTARQTMQNPASASAHAVRTTPFLLSRCLVCHRSLLGGRKGISEPPTASLAARFPQPGKTSRIGDVEKVWLWTGIWGCEVEAQWPGSGILPSRPGTDLVENVAMRASPEVLPGGWLTTPPRMLTSAETLGWRSAERQTFMQMRDEATTTTASPLEETRGL